MADEHLRAAALHVQGVRESKRIAQEESVNAETAAFVGYMFGLELGLALGQIDPGWSKIAHDELTEFNIAIGHDDRRRRMTLVAVASAIIRATTPEGG
jgi:hypothetical protein